MVFMNHLKLFEEFNQSEKISENLKYHLEKNLSVIENVFRPGSDNFYRLLSEARVLYDKGIIDLPIDDDIFKESDIGKFDMYEGNIVPLDLPMLREEAEYKGKEVELNKPMRSSGPKKYKVYVKMPNGNIKVVHFGDVKGGLTAKINNPEARKSFVARHDCKNKTDKTKAGYWSCRLPRFKNLVKTKYNGYW
jgi:hypothetical protein